MYFYVKMTHILRDFFQSATPWRGNGKLSFTEVSLEAGREKSGKGASTKAEVAQKRQFPLCGVGRRRYAEKGQRKGGSCHPTRGGISRAQELPIQMSHYAKTLHAELNSMSIGLPPNEKFTRMLLEFECTSKP